MTTRDRLTPLSTVPQAGDPLGTTALAAPVADPLWLLARQWQTGEFTATDGGSAARASVTWSSGAVLHRGAAVRSPLEEWVEPERPPHAVELDRARRLRLASELSRRLKESGLSAAAQESLRGTWRRIYPLALRLPDPTPLLGLLGATLDDAGAGSIPSVPGLADFSVSERTAVESVLRDWYVWCLPSFTPAAAGSGPVARRAPGAWDASRLMYRVDCNLELPAGHVDLTADDYDGTGLDWYSVDRSSIAPSFGPPDVSIGSAEVHPAQIEYAGMPRPRWWEFEDGDVNLDSLRSGDDPAHSTLATFAHSFANDWFICPLTAEAGWLRIDSLMVTDTFGAATDVPSVAELDSDAGPWRLWDVTQPAGKPAVSPATGLRLCWPVSSQALDGAPIEDVLLARDEMANLAWIIELRTSDAEGATVDRFRRWLELRSSDGVPGSATPTAGRADQASHYRLGTSVPDFWYPLRAAGDPSSTMFRLATLPPGATGVGDTGVQGVLVEHDSSTALTASTISRQGRRVVRRRRLMLGFDGMRIWTVRIGTPGEGEASSGLRFDLLQ